MWYIWNECDKFRKVPFGSFVILVDRMVDTKTLTKYKCILASFMSFLHNRPVGGEYHRDHVHAMEVLAAITPNDVLRYMNLKTFGTTEPAGDANPISARANSLAMDKKAISYFMPNRDMWSVTRTEGNPTRSVLINGLIKQSSLSRRKRQGNKGWIHRLEDPACLVRNLL